MKKWEQIIPEKEREIFKKAGYGIPQPIGGNPALLVIDIVQSFVGTEPKNVLEGIDEFATSCGNAAWESIDFVKKIIDKARVSNIEIIYTKRSKVDNVFCGIATKRKMRHKEAHVVDKIISEIEPMENEYVLEKAKASAFFGTPLATYLIMRKIDYLFVIGTSTSGCVRATVIDAFSYGYPVFVIEEGCFDRSEFFHHSSLFDMNAKYATVISYTDFCEVI